MTEVAFRPTLTLHTKFTYKIFFSLSLYCSVCDETLERVKSCLSNTTAQTRLVNRNPSFMTDNIIEIQILTHCLIYQQLCYITCTQSGGESAKQWRSDLRVAQEA